METSTPPAWEWERTVQKLQTSVDDTCQRFEQELGSGRGGSSVMFSGIAQSLVDASAQADIRAVYGAGDGDLLEGVAHDLLVCALRSRIAPSFWRSISEAAGPPGKAVLAAGWSKRWEAATVMLRQLQMTHQELLRALGSSRTDQLVKAYCMSFRSVMTATWPLGIVEHLQLYFLQTWKECMKHRGRKKLDEGEAEEWWWAALPGESFPAGPASRVLTLLNPLRRPSMNMPSKHGSNVVGNTAREAGSHAMTAPIAMSVGSTHSAEVDMSLDASELQDDDMQEDEDEDEDSQMQPESSEGEFPQSLSCLCTASGAMHCMGLGEEWQDVVMRFFAEQIITLVEERCRSEYDKKGLLDRLTALLYDPMLRWLRAAHGLAAIAGRALPSPEEEEATEWGTAFQAEDAWWCSARRALLQFFEAFLQVRIGEAFDMVRDFPDSAPALLDLKRCLARTGQSAPLVQALRQQIIRRLLIAGAHTRDVIKVYIKTIKALRLVDPQGLLLEGVSTPIREFLKRRKDTVRCIIMALTEDTDLQYELQQGAEALAAASKGARNQASGTASGSAAASALAQASQLSDLTGGAEFEASDDEENPDSWVPDPIDADPQMPTRQRRAQDVISLLVGIYGSKELFIKEYKEMLADRLLGNPTYSTEKEMQNLELLKTRFGEAALAHCEVMLQDIKDSKRINVNLQQRQQQAAESDILSLSQMHALVLSQHYWPSALSKADHPRFKLPQPLEDALAEYGAAYSRVRAKRSVQWKRAHGLVEITVQLADRSLKVVVTPIHYAVLSCFSDDGDTAAEGQPASARKRRSLQEVASQLELPEALVRKRISFWVAKNVLREVSADVFDLQESLSTMEGAGSAAGTGSHLDEDAERSPQAAGSGAGGREQAFSSAERQACGNFVQGMITNYGPLPLGPIHNFLQRFMMDPAYTQTEAQLREFLTQLCHEGRLEFDGSSYALVKPGAS
eukprot:TRINITY_DN28876_c0_g1_i1.p1 TRINITY_DN28876_c0_g1~~TRINITY_DN28876_c0_g1_i1.p1  ORF type:complete len:964 (+),score=238.11 TRINITY_DN28876_c0_g1_i1:36-2927(+)